MGAELWLYKNYRDDGGWGVAPRDVKSFSAVSGNGKATISWAHDGDTVIDGQKICRVRGIEIRRAETAAELETEKGGTLVTDSKSLSGTYPDTSVANGRTYYYKAFPYSDHGVYNRGCAVAKGEPRNAAFLTVSFTATAAKGMSVTARQGNEEVTQKVGNDGKAVLCLGKTGEWDVGGRKVSVSTMNDTPQVAGRMLAVHYSETNPDPDSANYPAGYDNSKYTPMSVNLSTGKPSYGSWGPGTADGKWIYPKSCMLKYDGTVGYYLNEDDETKRTNGSASDVANKDYGGNAMMEWAQDGAMIAWKIAPDADKLGWTFVMANMAIGDLKPWNHYNAGGGLSKHFYTPKYFGGNDGAGKLRSISGLPNYVSQDAATEATLARANNVGGKKMWDTETYADWLFLQMTTVLVTKSLNSQSKLGSGRCLSSNTSAIGTGTMNGRGPFYGSSNQTSGVKAFGMENPWGNIWRRIRGLVISNGHVKVKLTLGTHDGSAAADYNLDGSGYIDAGPMPTGTSGGYTSAMTIGDRYIVPKTVSGSATTLYCDGCWFASNAYALVGGGWGSVGLVGAFYARLNSAASASAPYFGAALSCKPY